MNLRILGSDDLGLGVLSRDSRGFGLDGSGDSSVGSEGGTGDLGGGLDGSFGRCLDGSGLSKSTFGSDGVRFLGLTSARATQSESDSLPWGS
jgi:hypothetical protein